jgi:fructose-specific phosphotransferase system component IIB
MGIENRLAADDIARADLVVFAAGIALRERERFAGKRIVEVPVQDAIKDPERVIGAIGA